MSVRRCDGCYGSWGYKGEAFTYLGEVLYLCEDCAQVVYNPIDTFHKMKADEDD